jgi:hypothetical protein
MSGPWCAIAGHVARDRRDLDVPIDRRAGIGHDGCISYINVGHLARDRQESLARGTQLLPSFAEIRPQNRVFTDSGRSLRLASGLHSRRRRRGARGAYPSPVSLDPALGRIEQEEHRARRTRSTHGR